jgi:hypothetical protein
LILLEFIRRAPSSCRATLFDFMPFFLLAYLGEICSCPSPVLIPSCPIYSCVHLSPLDFSSSLRRNRYWIQSSCSTGTLSMPCLFHCSSMFGRSIPSLSTISMRLGYSVPTSLGVIFTYLFASCMGVLVSLVYLSIGVVLPPCSILLLNGLFFVLICGLFLSFSGICLFLSSLFPFFGFIPPFHSGLGFHIDTCWGFAWFLVCYFSVFWLDKTILILLYFGVFLFLFFY